MIRALVLILLLASLGWWLEREHQAGRFQRVDELFLDFLVANARDRFATAAPQASPSVVWVKMRNASKAEYAGWPPRPLDWQMVLKGLQPFDPAVLVIPETLMWGKPPPEFVREAAEALVPFPSTILGVEAQLAASPDAPAFMGGLEDSLPRFQKAQGDIAAVPPLGALIAAPDDLLRRQAELGVAVTRNAEDVMLLPYALQESGNLRPSVLTQALARITQTPYATHRLLLGPGAGAYLSNGAFVPLTTAGEFAVDAKQTVPEVDALNLMSDGLADALSAQDKANLSGGKVIVIGTDDAGLVQAHAQALAQILAMPRLKLLPSYAQWLIWSAAVLAGFWLVFRVPKEKALLRGLLFIFAALVVCFLAFQSNLIWSPPTMPAALIAASALFARIAGRRQV
ncbi:MAG: hypothetical protein ACKVY0_06450 [Prosthecobacter sp.]|uniref:hypothetical protein n=1 Tax=Prosthecobacter sp. TaxID=1965333 RepID=UPI0038FFA528